MRLPDSHDFLDWAQLLQSSLQQEALNQCASAIQAFQNDDGGFSGRSASSDIYYSFFSVATLILLGKPFERLAFVNYLKQFDNGQDLDLVHACCLLRCRNLMALTDAPGFLRRRLSRSQIAQGLAAAGHRPLINHISDLLHSNYHVYDWFLTLGSTTDIASIENFRSRLTAALDQSGSADGAYGAPGAAKGTTTVTAAAICLSHLIERPDSAAANWLRQQHIPGSGFRANSEIPIPDLLSTAAAVNAFTITGYNDSSLAGDSLSFTESCWGNDGLFFASPCEPTGDPEYTFYGLLILAQLLTA